MPIQFASPETPSLPLYVLEADSVEEWAKSQSQRIQNWVAASGFKGAIGASLIIPGEDGVPEAALVGYGTAAARARVRFTLAAAVASLGDHTYHIVSGVPEAELENEVLGWLFTGYAFDRYRKQSGTRAGLVAPDGIDSKRTEILAQAEVLTRDLINTPTSDMGPPELEAAARTLAGSFDASIQVTVGDDLLGENFPMIHAVGRASAMAPRLIDIRWGSVGPKVTLVGKGVCFDTGGLNLKPGGSMGLMKKDMGGAANVLGLAHMIMALGLPIQLRVLVPAVENSVSGNSFRPQDILTSRKGLTVEINNTDAEGRLVLADALAYASEEPTDYVISMATLTGAARVAVGPDIAPYFTDDSAFAHALETAGDKAADPVWRLPFHTPYESMIEPGIADLDNAPKGGFAGASTAALFLRRFVQDAPHPVNYTHFDVYGWQPSAAPGRSIGGFGQGQRALLTALIDQLNL